MNHIASLLQELEESIPCGSDESRLRALWHATDVLTAGQYSEKDIWVFGEVIELLARELEVAARAELARWLNVVGSAELLSQHAFLGKHLESHDSPERKTAHPRSNTVIPKYMGLRV
jgi:hypothetical protein